jgi:hypothetical protein
MELLGESIFVNLIWTDTRAFVLLKTTSKIRVRAKYSSKSQTLLGRELTRGFVEFRIPVIKRYNS